MVLAVLEPPKPHIKQTKIVHQTNKKWPFLSKRIIAIAYNQLNRAVAAWEAKNVEIGNFNLLLSQERNRNDNHRNGHDHAVAERAEVLGILSNVRATVEKAEIPLRLRRKRNCNVVADNGGEQLVIECGGQSRAERLSNAGASRADLAA